MFSMSDTTSLDFKTKMKFLAYLIISLYETERTQQSINILEEKFWISCDIRDLSFKKFLKESKQIL